MKKKLITVFFVVVAVVAIISGVLSTIPGIQKRHNAGSLSSETGSDSKETNTVNNGLIVSASDSSDLEQEDILEKFDDDDYQSAEDNTETISIESVDNSILDSGKNQLTDPAYFPEKISGQKTQGHMSESEYGFVGFGIYDVVMQEDGDSKGVCRMSFQGTFDLTTNSEHIVDQLSYEYDDQGNEIHDHITYEQLFGVNLDNCKTVNDVWCSTLKEFGIDFNTVSLSQTLVYEYDDYYVCNYRINDKVLLTKQMPEEFTCDYTEGNNTLMAEISFKKTKEGVFFPYEMTYVFNYENEYGSCYKSMFFSLSNTDENGILLGSACDCGCGNETTNLCETTPSCEELSECN